MRRASLLLLAVLRLGGAKPHSFSIHEDVLAHPEFEVIFEDGAISENDARRLLKQDGERPNEGATDDGGGGSNEEKPPLPHAYELVNMGSYRCLCSIPVLKSAPAENRTATELARAEEAREEQRAVTSGWELIGDLEDTCLYYMSGWWSYSFCNNREIVQYHALASSPKGQPPKRDLHSPEYVLGRVPTIPSTSRHGGTAASTTEKTTTEHELDPIPAELQEKGKQRYLVQKLEGGTICDLTERERTIEVQYHCVPGLKADRISWIKEVTICAYLMVVDTPRLCKDVAFLPPEPTKANAITCQVVSSKPELLPESEEAGAAVANENGQDANKAGTSTKMHRMEAAVNVLKELIGAANGAGGRRKRAKVGEIVVGSRGLLSGADEAGRAPFKLTPPRSFLAAGLVQEPKTKVVVAAGASRQNGGETTVMSREELKKLNVDPKAVYDMAENMQNLAGDEAWHVEMSESNLAGIQELEGIIDKEEGGPGVGSKVKAKQKRERIRDTTKKKKEEEEAEEGTDDEGRGGEKAVVDGEKEKERPEEERQALEMEADEAKEEEREAERWEERSERGEYSDGVEGKGEKEGSKNEEEVESEHGSEEEYFKDEL